MFKNIKKEKELIDRELEIYRQEETLKTNKSIEDYRELKNREIENLAKRCADELGQYEHTYHYAKETKGIEIAKLESRIQGLGEVIKAREEVAAADNNLLKSKDAEIKRLTDIITLFINKQPSTIIQQTKQN